MLNVFHCWNNPELFLMAGSFESSLHTDPHPIHVIRTKRIPFFRVMQSGIACHIFVNCYRCRCPCLFPNAAALGFTALRLNTGCICWECLFAYVVITQLVKTWFY
jgi:hypothetical protein